MFAEIRDHLGGGDQAQRRDVVLRPRLLNGIENLLEGLIVGGADRDGVQRGWRLRHARRRHHAGPARHHPATPAAHDHPREEAHHPEDQHQLEDPTDDAAETAAEQATAEQQAEQAAADQAAHESAAHRALILAAAILR